MSVAMIARFLMDRGWCCARRRRIDKDICRYDRKGNMPCCRSWQDITLGLNATGQKIAIEVELNRS